MVVLLALNECRVAKAVYRAIELTNFELSDGELGKESEN